MKRLAAIMLLFIFSLVSCFSFETKTGAFKLTKEEAIARAKDLLDQDNIYMFDCDFSLIEGIEIEDVSYNIYISGTILEDENESDYLDLSKYPDIKLVTNYKIKAIDSCFGFSLVANIMEGAHKSVMNGVESFVPTKIYDESTFKGVYELYHQGYILNDSNPDKHYIKVDNEFYGDLYFTSQGIYIDYFNIEGEYNLIQGIKIIDRPIDIVCHYPKGVMTPDYDDPNYTVKIINDYFYGNAVYKSF